ncbi:hypothetical protein CAUP111243_01550 [Campylobacter upsaliensis]|uniref:Uncharacterized protein n=1 Tax=Campylobacter upsaliensis TaxID=28080 RepID=A0A448KLY4_CAMUP|nr:hypothetical protein [Campylobacter upsaliensis]MCA5589796.1 hypothetical protein [Campylobacter upsaliensis]MCA5589876.1 hypothetical protein [Campylobacter upsaliensis]VEG84383.1 Uncharacterised protein [Campylobacter upsaliensis]
MGLTGRTKRKRKRYYNQAMNQFGAIIEKYELGMAANEYSYIAWAIADAKVEASKGIFGGFNIFGGIFTIIGSIFTGGILGIVGGGLGLAANKIMTGNALKAGDLAFRANATYAKSAWQKAFNDSRNKGDQSLLNSDKNYSIYADGSIYRQNAPGSESYSPSLAYDTSKGLRGDLKEDKVDEMIMTRAHYTQGGNEGFVNELGEGYIQKGEGGISVKEKQDSHLINAKKANDRILKGFSELVGVGFDFKGTANKHYEAVVAKQVHPFFRQICTEDFIDKNKNYNRALRLELPLHFDELTKTRRQSKEERDKAFKESESFKRVLNEDYEKWLGESEELKELEKALENAGWFYKKIERQIAKLKEENKKRLEKALFESEKALMSGDYYIQKSRLYTLEEKRENYAQMVEVRVEDFIKKVPFVCFYKDEAALNNASFLNTELFYNENSTWISKNSKDIDSCFDTLFSEDSDENIISFYETYILNHFAPLVFKNGESKEAFYLIFEGKIYLKVVENAELLKERVYRGF